MSVYSLLFSVNSFGRTSVLGALLFPVNVSDCTFVECKLVFGN